MGPTPRSPSPGSSRSPRSLRGRGAGSRSPGGRQLSPDEMSEKMIELRKYKTDEEKRRVKQTQELRKELAMARRLLLAEIQKTRAEARKKDLEQMKTQKELDKLEEREQLMLEKGDRSANAVEGILSRIDEKHSEKNQALAAAVSNVGRDKGHVAFLQFAMKSLEDRLIMPVEIPRTDKGRQGDASTQEVRERNLERKREMEALIDQNATILKDLVGARDELEAMLQLEKKIEEGHFDGDGDLEQHLRMEMSPTVTSSTGSPISPCPVVDKLLRSIASTALPVDVEQLTDGETLSPQSPSEGRWPPAVAEVSCSGSWDFSCGLSSSGSRGVQRSGLAEPEGRSRLGRDLVSPSSDQGQFGGLQPPWMQAPNRPSRSVPSGEGVVEQIGGGTTHATTKADGLPNWLLEPSGDTSQRGSGSRRSSAPPTARGDSAKIPMDTPVSPKGGNSVVMSPVGGASNLSTSTSAAALPLASWRQPAPVSLANNMTSIAHGLSRAVSVDQLATGIGYAGTVGSMASGTTGPLGGHVGPYGHGTPSVQQVHSVMVSHSSSARVTAPSLLAPSLGASCTAPAGSQPQELSSIRSTIPSRFPDMVFRSDVSSWPGAQPCGSQSPVGSHSMVMVPGNSARATLSPSTNQPVRGGSQRNVVTPIPRSPSAIGPPPQISRASAPANMVNRDPSWQRGGTVTEPVVEGLPSRAADSR